MLAAIRLRSMKDCRRLRAAINRAFDALLEIGLAFQPDPLLVQPKRWRPRTRAFLARMTNPTAARARHPNPEIVAAINSFGRRSDLRIIWPNTGPERLSHNFSPMLRPQLLKLARRQSQPVSAMGGKRTLD